MAGTAGNAGDGGWSIGIYDESDQDGIAPVVSGNAITPGIGGLDSAPSSSEGPSLETNF